MRRVKRKKNYESLHFVFRNKKSSCKKSDNSFTYLKLFLIFLFFVILVNLFIKSINSFKESKLNNDYFNLLVVNKDYFLINFDKNDNVASGFKIINVDKKILDSIFRTSSNKDLNSSAKEKLSIYLDIPIDAVLKSRGIEGESDINEIFTIGGIYSFIINSSNYDLYNLNKVDFLKIYLLSFSIPLNNIKVNMYDKSIGFNENTDIVDLIKDENIINEKVSIQIINATGVNGVGTKIADMLKNIGFNVVSIDSSKDKSSKIIYRTDENYTIKRLKNYFSFPALYKSETAIADVSIIISNDYKINLIDLTSN